MSPKYTTPQWLNPRPRRLARLRIPGSHPKSNIVTHQTMEDLPVTFEGMMKVSIHCIIHDFVLPMFFWAGRKKKSGKIRHFKNLRYGFFPKQVYLWGSLLEKNRLDTLLGALGLVGRGFGPAGRAGLGWAWGLAVLGALAGLGVLLGVGFGCAWRAGWVGRGVGRRVWPCWAR